MIACSALAGTVAFVGLHAQALARTASEAAPELRALIPDVRRAGATRLTVWGFDVYDATLWVSPGFEAGRWAQRSFALELRYLRDFDGDDIARRSLDEMRRAKPLSEAQAAQWLDEMKRIFPDVRKGDRLLGVYGPERGVRFFCNARPTGEVRDPVFARRFFEIWFGAQTSEPAMREALLAPVAR